MLAELNTDMNDIRRKAQDRGQQKVRVQRLVDERIMHAEDSEKSRTKRGAFDKEDDGDEMEVDESRTRGGRVSKRFGLGRNG